MPSTPQLPSPPVAPDADALPGPVALTRELHLRRQELRALLDITEAVNDESLTEEKLYLAFGYTLLGQLGLGRVALFVPGESEAGAWRCSVSLPAKPDFRGTTLPDALFTLGPTGEPIPANADVPDEWRAFRTVLPVRHKTQQRLLAFVLVGESLAGKRSADYSTQETLEFVQTLSSIVLVAAQNRGLARERLARELLQREIDITRDVQQMLFPKRLPNTAAIQVCATYLPHAQVGGDYYDCVALPDDRYLLCVADVSGKGVPASLLMANFQAGLRTLARLSTPLTDVVRELNHLIHSNAEAEKFITAFVAVYDGRTRELHYVNAGHNPPLIARPDGSIEVLSDGTLMLGILDPLPFLTEGATPALPPGATLLMYTDGLTDVFDDAGTEYGDAGVADSLRWLRALPLPEVHAALLRSLGEHSPISAANPHPYPDDITILSARFA